MFCPNCGSPINEDEKFCPNCGTPAGSTGQGMDAGGMGTVNNGISKPQNQDLDMVMRIVCGVFAVVLLGFIHISAWIGKKRFSGFIDIDCHSFFCGYG